MNRTGKRRKAVMYVEAVVADAKSSDAWSTWEDDLGALALLVSEEHGRRFLQNTSVSIDERVAVAERAAGGNISPRGFGLLRLLAEERDVDLIDDIRQRVIGASDEVLGVDRVHVTTAIELEEAAVQDLSNRLQAPARTLRMTTEVDDKLLGGFVIRRGDDVLDLSVRARLMSLAATLR